MTIALTAIINAVKRFFEHPTETKGSWTSHAINLWIKNETKLGPPATIDEINAVEKNLSFQFPPDFKELYLKVDGFVDWDWTANMFSIWPLPRIVDEYNRANDKTFIVFADYLINTHHIGFVKGQEGVFKNHGTTPELIANSFSEAIWLINSDAEVLY